MPRTSTTATEGNTLAVKGGWRSERIVAVNVPPAVAEVQDALAESLPYLEPPDALLVESAARLIVRLRLVDGYIDRLGGSLIDVRGRPRGCSGLYLSLTRELRTSLAALGVGPEARARVLGDLTTAQRDKRAAEAVTELRRRYGPEVTDR